MFPKSDVEDTIGSPRFDFNATKWENVLRSLRGTFFVERGAYEIAWQMFGALDKMVAQKNVKIFFNVV